jgi:hypothetical protein
VGTTGVVNDVFGVDATLVLADVGFVGVKPGVIPEGNGFFTMPRILFKIEFCSHLS